MATHFANMNQALEHTIRYLENMQNSLEREDIILSEDEMYSTLTMLEKECHDLARYVNQNPGTTVESNLKAKLIQMINNFQKSAVFSQKMGALQQRFFKSFKQIRNVFDRGHIKVTKTEQEGTRTG